MKVKFSIPIILVTITLCIYVIGLIWWAWLQYFDLVGTTMNYFFNIPMALSPLIVGGVLIFSSLQQSLSFSLKRYPLYFGLYLFLWGVGIFCTIFYNIFLDIELQYPSLLDIANTLSQVCFFIAIIGYIITIRQFSHVKNVLQNIVFFAGAPLIQLVLYGVVIAHVHHSPIADISSQFFMSMVLVFLNLVSFIILYILAFTLLFQSVDKKYLRIGWLTILLMTIQYMNDYYFIVVLAQSTFYIGNPVDVLYLSSYVLASYVGIEIYKRIDTFI